MNWRKSSAAVLIGCLLFTSVPGSAATTDLDGLKKKVDLLGSGAQVKLKLSDGQKLRGHLGAIEDNAFHLSTNQGTEPRRIAFGDLSQIQPAKKDYRATGAPDSAEARRAIVGLGEGHHVMVRVAGGRVMRGHIGSIEPTLFTLLPDGGADVVPIAYDDVLHVRKNPATSTIVIIAVGAALATVLLVFWAIRESNE